MNLCDKCKAEIPDLATMCRARGCDTPLQVSSAFCNDHWMSLPMHTRIRISRDLCGSGGEELIKEAIVFLAVLDGQS